MGKINDLTGKTFGRLTVKYRGENTSQGLTRWWCQCNCGNPELILVQGTLLSFGKVKSCGCLHKDVMKQKRSKNKYLFNSDSYIGYDNNGHSFLIDADDYEKVCQYYWYQNSDGYFVTHIRNKTLLLHRFIMDATKDEIVDHRFHDTSDNRKSVLRKCTSSDNNSNRKITDKNKSGVVGVSWDDINQKWRASIKKNGESIYLGEYNDITDAIKARKEAEEKYFGEFSYDNSMQPI